MQTAEKLAPVRALAGDRAVDLRELLRALRAVREGDFSVRLPADWTGMSGKIADTFNDIVATNERTGQTQPKYYTLCEPRTIYTGSKTWDIK